jgi:hypothetical protein
MEGSTFRPSIEFQGWFLHPDGRAQGAIREDAQLALDHLRHEPESPLWTGYGPLLDFLLHHRSPRGEVRP